MDDKSLVWWKSGEHAFYSGYGINTLDNIEILEDSYDSIKDEFNIKLKISGIKSQPLVLYRKYIAPITGTAIFSGISSDYASLRISNKNKILLNEIGCCGNGYREVRVLCDKGDVIDAWILVYGYTLEEGKEYYNYATNEQSIGSINYSREVCCKNLNIRFEDDDYSYSYSYNKLINSDRKKVLVIGDSTTGFYQQFCSWTDILNRKYNDIFVEGIGFSGASYCDRSHRGFKPFTAQNIIESLLNKDYKDLLITENNLSRIFYSRPRADIIGCDIEKFDTIALFLGAIDYYDGAYIYLEDNPDNVENTFAYRISKIVDTITEHFPDKELVFILPYFNQQLNDDPTTTKNSSGFLLTDYTDCIKKVTKSHHSKIKIIDLLNEFNCNKENLREYSFDKMHFSYEGLTKLADFLYTKLK